MLLIYKTCLLLFYILEILLFSDPEFSLCLMDLNVKLINKDREFVPLSFFNYNLFYGLSVKPILVVKPCDVRERSMDTPDLIGEIGF